MLELTPHLEPGSGRLAVHIMEPGGSLWLMRFGAARRPRDCMLLVPPRHRARLAELNATIPADQGLRLERRGVLLDPQRHQRITLEPADRERLTQALLTLERFEANPDLPEWHERGYRTAAEADALIADHPEWFPDPEGSPDASP